MLGNSQFQGKTLFDYFGPLKLISTVAGSLLAAGHQLIHKFSKGFTAFKTPAEDTKITRFVKNPFLYELAKDGKKSYILGTNHVLPLSILPPTCQAIIQNTHHLFTEVLSFPDGTTEIKPLTYEELEELEMLNPEYSSDKNWFTELSVPEQKLFKHYWAQIKHYYPAKLDPTRLTARVVSSDLEMLSQKAGMDHIIELHHVRGSHSGIKSYALDDRDSPRIDDEQPSIACALKILNEKQEDLDFLTGQLNHIVLDGNVLARNQYWIRKLLDELPKLNEQALVVVGADHLGGEQGLLYLFSQAGYDIKRINQKGKFKPCLYSDPVALKAFFQDNKTKEQSMRRVNTLISKVLSDTDYSEEHEELYNLLNELQNLIPKSRTFNFREFSNITECLTYYEQNVEDLMAFTKMRESFNTKIQSLVEILLDESSPYEDEHQQEFHALMSLQKRLLDGNSLNLDLSQFKLSLLSHQDRVSQLVPLQQVCPRQAHDCMTLKL